MKLTESQRIDIETCEYRALKFLSQLPKSYLCKASAVAYDIWPNHKMTAQGAGASSSRILKRLEKKGLVEWTIDATSIWTADWGWIITDMGRKELKGK